MFFIVIDGLVKFWIVDGELVWEFVGKFVVMIFNGVFSRDGKVIIIVGYNGVVCIWDV